MNELEYWTTINIQQTQIQDLPNVSLRSLISMYNQLMYNLNYDVLHRSLYRDLVRLRKVPRIRTFPTTVLWSMKMERYQKSNQTPIMVNLAVYLLYLVAVYPTRTYPQKSFRLFSALRDKEIIVTRDMITIRVGAPQDPLQVLLDMTESMVHE